MADGTKQFIKGITFKSRADFVTDAYGPNAFGKLIPHLSGELKAMVEDPVRVRPTAWYPFDYQQALDEAIYKVLASGDANVFRRMGAFSADYENRNNLIKIFTDPWRFLNHQPTIWSRYFKPGSVDVIRVSDREAKVHLHSFRSSEANCQTNLGYFIRSIEICGAEDVHVVETQCTKDPGVEYCEFRIRWH